MAQNWPVEKVNNLQRLVIDKIIATSKGMFLLASLASLQVRPLEMATSIREIKDVLSVTKFELLWSRREARVAYTDT
jgi:hypothetical protein